MDWLLLCFAGVCEMGWPIGMKMTQDPSKRWWGMILAIGSMLLSFSFSLVGTENHTDQHCIYGVDWNWSDRNNGDRNHLLQ